MYEELVKLARNVVDNYTLGKKKERPHISEEFERKQGAFCTLNTYPDGQLRGCIGVPYPIMPLTDAVIEASRGACRDPRFPPLRPDELNKITVELSVLTEPKRTKPEEIVIGRDGLIIVHEFGTGLLLPQVPIEFKWNMREYLKNLCYKAGLSDGCWKSGELYAFQAKVYKEVEPHGKVIEWKP